MRALLLAAGTGNRLRPLTDIVPKCLAPIRGRPLLDHWFQMLFSDCITEALINTHHHSDLVESFIQASPWARRVTVVREERLLGTGGTVYRNRDFFRGSEPFLVAHVDNLSLFRPTAFLEAHGRRPRVCLLTMMTFRTSDPRSCGIVTIDESGVVTSFYEKVSDPPGNLANAAVYIFEPAVLDYLRDLCKEVIDLSTELLPNFIGRIFTFENITYHRDIGTLSSWKQAQHDFPREASVAWKNASWTDYLHRDGGAVQNGIDRLLQSA